MRTRGAALVRAARTFLAAGTRDVPVLAITRAADVGMGSFYNHFDRRKSCSGRRSTRCSTTRRVARQAARG